LKPEQAENPVDKIPVFALAHHYQAISVTEMINKVKQALMPGNKKEGFILAKILILMFLAEYGHPAGSIDQVGDNIKNV